MSSLLYSNLNVRTLPFIACCHPSNSRIEDPKISIPIVRKVIKYPNSHLLKSVKQVPIIPARDHDDVGVGLLSPVGGKQMLLLCGLGYWLQGFRCFPWLALNFHLVQVLKMDPATLQLVQFSANLPMVAKPLYGILSDSVYFGEAHRLPYMSFGALVQILSWSSLALIPAMGTFPAQIACILLGNFGASLVEVASDALVAEFSKRSNLSELQSYAFMALAAGGILGNLSGGLFLQQTEPKIMFLIFSSMLLIQLTTCLTTKETSLYPSEAMNDHLIHGSITKNLRQQCSSLMDSLAEESISRPLIWIVASIAVVPVLSGTTFCFQTQHLLLNPSVIGLSKVAGQLLVLCATIFYNKYLKNMPIRKLIWGVQVLYAISVLSDWFLVKQLNINVGISNEAYVLCFSALGEAIAQFKLLPFFVLFANLSRPGGEGSLIAFLASALCLASTVGGFFGVGLASVLRVSSEDYSNLPVGILLQFVASMLPLGWISLLPRLEIIGIKKKKRNRRRMLSLPNSYMGRRLKLLNRSD